MDEAYVALGLGVINRAWSDLDTRRHRQEAIDFLTKDSEILDLWCSVARLDKKGLIESAKAKVNPQS